MEGHLTELYNYLFNRIRNAWSRSYGKGDYSSPEAIQGSMLRSWRALDHILRQQANHSTDY
jgi:hypothetical protein